MMEASLQLERAPYGRETLRDTAVSTRSLLPQAPPYHGETYYGQPALKSSHYGTLIAQYFFIGGVAGGAQMIATVVDFCGQEEDRTVVRTGRYLALAGAAASPVFLIADLHTPHRWYNMIRIFRQTSAMSIGAWTLTVFGTLSGLTAAAQLLEDYTGRLQYRRLARWLGVPAALISGSMATYTGVLLSATSTPMWAVAERLIPALFGVSSVSTATAALSLVAHLRRGPTATLRRLERLALLTSSVELVLAAALEQRWRQAALTAPLSRQAEAVTYRGGFQGLGIIAPALLHGLNLLTRTRSRRWSVIAALAALAGGYALRSVVVSAGNISAKHADAYFRLTQS